MPVRSSPLSGTNDIYLRGQAEESEDRQQLEGALKIPAEALQNGLTILLNGALVNQLRIPTSTITRGRGPGF